VVTWLTIPPALLRRWSSPLLKRSLPLPRGDDDNFKQNHFCIQMIIKKGELVEVTVKEHTHKVNTRSETEQLLAWSTIRKEIKARVLSVGQIASEQERLVHNEQKRKSAADLKLERDLDRDESESTPRSTTY
jgi:hypothetical protein